MVKQRPGKPKSGSEMSTKQVARTVLDGRLVTFRFPPDDVEIEGYVFGADDYHWAVVTPAGSKHLVHKGAPIVTLADEPTLHTEPRKEDLEKLVAPFRRFAESTYFGRSEGADPASDEDEREPASCS